MFAKLSHMGQYREQAGFFDLPKPKRCITIGGVTESPQELIARIIAEQTLIHAVVAGKTKIAVRPVAIRGERRYQFEERAGKKITHRNLTGDEARKEFGALLAGKFQQAQFYTRDADYHVLPGKILRKPATKKLPATLAHDRQKQRIIEEGQPCGFLIRLGVMRKDGSVIPGKYDKFRQINRFLEMVDEVGIKPSRIVDFGAGKSYLTFGLYHQFPGVEITGVDANPDIVAFCNEVARDLKYDRLKFVAGDIAGFEAENVDMVVALHACDTATDDALAKAVEWNAKVILAAPCCQHELAGQIASDVMKPLLKHGLTKERVAALVTDALRAQLLEVASYSVQLLEFVETEHTPKNLLIRAVRRDSNPYHDRLLAEYKACRDAWGVAPRLERAILRA